MSASSPALARRLAAVLLAGSALLLGLHGAIRAATTQTPPGAGIVIVPGVVLEDGTGDPVARAQVVPFPDPPRAGDDADQFAPVLSGPGGRFTLRLPPGRRVIVRAQRTGYLAGAIGQWSPGDTGVTVEVRGEAGTRSRDELVVLVWRPAVIEGRVIDDREQPVIEAPVEVFAVDPVTGRLAGTAAGRDDTDDRGIFRVSGLWPGTYVVSARDAQPVPGPRTFHPDAGSVAGAARVTAANGATTTGIDIHLWGGPQHAITGRVDGLPRDARVRLLASGDTTPDAGIGSSMEVAAVPTGPAGRFDFPAVRPGTYVLEVVSVPDTLRPGGRRSTGARGRAGGGGANARGDTDVIGRGPSPDATYWSRRTVTVEDEDVDVGAMTVLPGRTVAGTVVRSDDDAPVAPAAAVVGIAPAEGGDLGAAGLVRLEADQSFRTVGLPPGTYRLRALAGLGWFFEGLQRDGDWLPGDRIDVAFDDVTGVRIVLSDRPTRVTGRVVGADGEGRPGVRVYVFPADRETRASASHFRRKGADTGADGVFVFEGLQRGDYLAVAVADPAPDIWAIPAALDRLAETATAFSIAPGESRQLELTVRR